MSAEVQLAELEATAREMQRSDESTAGLTLAGMTRIDAVRWEPARRRVTIAGIGGECGVEPILLDAFVAALRLADAPSMEMSLEPEQRRGQLWHRVVHFPRELAGTPLLASLTRADYFLKAIVLRRVETPLDELPTLQRVLDCRPPRRVEPVQHQHRSNNVYLYAQPPRYALSDDGTTVTLEQPKTELRHGPTPSSLTREFALRFTARYPAVEATHPTVFAGARNAFMLYHVADLLLEWARGYDFSYWRREYSLERRSVPRRLPSPIPRKLARFCGSVPTGVFELGRIVHGGAVTTARLSWNLPGVPGGLAGVFSDGREVLVLSRNGGAGLFNGATLASGTWRHAGTGLVRVTAEGRSMELGIDSARGLVDRAGGLWPAWGRDGPAGHVEAARGGNGSPVRVAGRGRPDAVSAGSPSSTRLSRSAASPTAWRPAAFREIARVAAEPSSPNAAEADSYSTQAAPLRSPFEGDDAQTLERKLERGTAEARTTVIDPFTRRWALAEVRARQGDVAGALEATAAAEALWDGQRSPVDHGRFLEQAGAWFERQGRLEAALERYERCRHVLSETSLEDEAQDVRCLLRLAGLYSETFDLDSAKALFAEARFRLQALAEPEVSLLFDRTLGWHRIREGRPAQAFTLFARVLDHLRAVGRSDPLQVAEARADLARAQAELGEDVKAERLLESALAELEAENLAHHPLASRILNDLVLARKRQGREGTRELIRRAEEILALAEKHYGPNHPSTVTALNNLGVLLGDAGRIKEASHCLDTALERLEKEAWEDFSLQTKVLRNRAGYAFLAGDRAVARELLNRAVILARHTLGPEHPETAAAVGELAVVTGLLGDRDEANRLYGMAASARATASDSSFADLALRRAALRTLGGSVDHSEQTQTKVRTQP